MAARRRMDPLPRWDGKRGWHGGDGRRLYAFEDRRTGLMKVAPGDQCDHIGSHCTVRPATRSEAVAEWQNPLNPGWKVEED